MIQLTEKAITEIKRLRRAEEQGPCLRIKVIGGGCSGMSYELEFVKEALEKDQVFEYQGVQVVCDAKSFLYLTGIVLDYSDGLSGKGFVFNNPNAKRTCGCGSSFSA